MVPKIVLKKWAVPKGPGNDFSSNSVPRHPQKTAFHLRGVLKITCWLFSDLFSKMNKKVTKVTQNGCQNQPKMTSKSRHNYGFDFYHIFEYFWHQNGAKMRSKIDQKTESCRLGSRGGPKGPPDPPQGSHFGVTLAPFWTIWGTFLGPKWIHNILFYDLRPDNPSFETLLSTIDSDLYNKQTAAFRSLFSGDGKQL